MKNRKILKARQDAKMYEDYYKPSFNLWRFFRAIIGVLVFGQATVAESYVPSNKRTLK